MPSGHVQLLAVRQILHHSLLVAMLPANDLLLGAVVVEPVLGQGCSGLRRVVVGYRARRRGANQVPVDRRA